MKSRSRDSLAYRVFSRDVIKFREPPMFLSPLGIRGTNFISVYNFPAQ